MLSALANPILPVFALMAIGLYFGKRNIFTEEMARNLNAYVFYIGQPALMFILAAKAPFGDYNIQALALYFVSELVVYVVVVFISYRVFKCDFSESILLGMTSVFVNHLYFVLPIVEILHGESAAAPIEGAIFVDVAVLYCGTIFVMECISRQPVSLTEFPKILGTNPALIALFLGIVANFAGALTPMGFITFADFAGRAAPPVVLFALGVILSRVDLTKTGKLVWFVIFANVIIHPLLVFGFMTYANIDSNWFNPLFLLSAGPCGAMPFVIALNYKVGTETLSKAILISTFISLISMAILTTLIN